MDKFLIRKPRAVQESSPLENFTDSNPPNSSKRSRIDLSSLPADPGLRQKISLYHPNDRDDIRRAYLLKGLCQPIQHNFPQTNMSGLLRRFNPAWFKECKNWLEYSIDKDAAFCLPCYLFRPDSGKHIGGDAFVSEGFRLWNRKEKLQIHVGGINSVHNQAVKGCQDLMNQQQHIQSAFDKHTNQEKLDYRTRLYATVVCVRHLLRQGQAFRGHDESEESSHRGNFLELLKFLADHNEAINKEVLGNTPKNHKLTHHDIQKDVVNAAACETTHAIIKDMGEAFFSILVDESRDISNKEQMAVVLRYVDKTGLVIERFLGIVHVSSTSALSLKAAIESLFAQHGLSFSRVRGQGYDGASNMRGEFNGLKALILRENQSAFYVHCFAHQLQLTLVAVAKKHVDVGEFFLIVANIVTVVGGSCKRQDTLRDAQVAKIKEALDNGDLKSGRGLNQVTSLKRACDTRWGSYYNTLVNLILMFSSAIEVLDMIKEDDPSTDHRAQASFVKKSMLSFEFAFSLHLVRNVMGITNELSIALQKKTQDIVNAMRLVEMSKKRLQMMRDDGWDSLLIEVSSFCSKHDIPFPDMSGMYVSSGRPQRKSPQITISHRYRVDLFYTVLDMQLHELNNRFTEANTELLLCMACLNPKNSFSAFDRKKLTRLAELYPCDFSEVDLMMLDIQLQNFIVDVRSDERFSELDGIGDLAEKLVKTEKHVIYGLLYLLVTLVLTLPVATASVERSFSAMKYIKSNLRNRMGDQWMNDCLVPYIESDIFNTVDNEAIMQRFQNMKSRRGLL